MFVVVVLLAVLASGGIGTLLRRRAGTAEPAGTVRKGDLPEVGVHAGFTNHH